MTVQLIPYLTLNGEARNAIAFYEQAMGAKVLSAQTFGEGPASPEKPMDEVVKGWIAHAVLKIGETVIFIADAEPGQIQAEGTRLTLCITTDDAQTTRVFYENLQEGGTILHPLEQTYFSPAYGMVTDKFGVTFQVFTNRPN
ncbi:VOC family protein [Paenibacillus albidus]|uniref:VOC family protein n=1 Tax=Paenibacillus albidus TaxID=2041023 RepID=A0A917C0M3_9BACL|nr:VOC family protein [Paenibacillus albidus]GGF66265.1 VOC family protein [Paenibacillus albidus]